MARCDVPLTNLLSSSHEASRKAFIFDSPSFHYWTYNKLHQIMHFWDADSIELLAHFESWGFEILHMISLAIVQHSFSLFRVSDVLVILLPLEESQLKINSSSNINPGIINISKWKWMWHTSSRNNMLV